MVRRIENIRKQAADQETLKAARANPEEYRDAVVHAVGDNTDFITLSLMMQDKVVDRSSLRL